MADTEQVKNYEQQFEEIYNSKIKPKLRILENERLKAKKKFDIACIIAFFIFIIALIMACIKRPAGFCIFFIALFPPIMLAINYFDNYRKRIKKVILPYILSMFGEFNIVERELISLDGIKRFGLLPYATRKSDDDHIIGTYEGMPVTITETNITHSTRGKNSRTVIDFLGLIITLKQEKNYKGYTIVGPASTTCPNGLEKVELEDAEFNKMYKVYSDNQIEARYLLTTSFMKRLKTTSDAAGASKAYGVFINDKFYLFLDYCGRVGSNAFFEVGNIHESLYNKNFIEASVMQLLMIFDLIKHLKLTQNIGM